MTTDRKNGRSGEQPERRRSARLEEKDENHATLNGGGAGSSQLEAQQHDERVRHKSDSRTDHTANAKTKVKVKGLTPATVARSTAREAGATKRKKPGEMGRMRYMVLGKAKEAQAKESNNTAYEEEDEGFAFTRTKSKRAKKNAVTSAATTTAESSKLDPAPTAAPAFQEETSRSRSRRISGDQSSTHGPTQKQESKPSKNQSSSKTDQHDSGKGAAKHADVPVGRRKTRRSGPDSPEPTNLDSSLIGSTIHQTRPQDDSSARSQQQTKHKREEYQVQDVAEPAQNALQSHHIQSPLKRPHRPSPMQIHTPYRDQRPSPGRAYSARKERDPAVSATSATPRGPTANAIAADAPLFDSTKISLPFADTPVIRRNKEMRKSLAAGAAGAGGSRRSSLGMRGRRASSLIDTGKSNAVPHAEVQSVDFYKHIESEGLTEPRRMRQLMIWCGTRALGDKPALSGRDSTAILAAREIQSQLLKDFSSMSTLSDWFGRVDTAPVPAPPRPNPKNIANQSKIVELEEQLARLRREREALDRLLDPPMPQSLPNMRVVSTPRSRHSLSRNAQSNVKASVPGTEPSSSQSTLLSGSVVDAKLLPPDSVTILRRVFPHTNDELDRQDKKASSAQSLSSSSSLMPSSSNTTSSKAYEYTQSNLPNLMAQRLEDLTNNLEFTIDSLASNTHSITSFYTQADRLADQTLNQAAILLDQRDQESLKRSMSDSDRNGADEDQTSKKKKEQAGSSYNAPDQTRDSKAVGVRDTLRSLSRVLAQPQQRS